jgi:hypothetical protein
LDLRYPARSGDQLHLPKRGHNPASGIGFVSQYAAKPTAIGAWSVWVDEF